jgi:hypothetical protein
MCENKFHEDIGRFATEDPLVDLIDEGHHDTDSIEKAWRNGKSHTYFYW